MDKRWDLSRLSFLVVEDNAHMRAILRSILSGFGVRQIFEASEGTDGLELAIDRQPDVILCDWAMHPVSGREFIQFLRAERDLTLSTIPIIVISANSRKTTILEARKMGIHGFIAKPVSPIILYQRIGGVLDNQAAHGRTKGVSRTSTSTSPLNITDLAPAGTKRREEKPSQSDLDQLDDDDLTRALL
ncbi:response regulator [Roseibium sp. CAU 1637]|uniref:Response regulator n=1 Tax=Roseibium limicola TaxID=2816037 RepID=A0A939EP08_9HYPH|nr:response regulator [Roseibium limicola]MBO0346106.1 response regulator [Roseibium limicola]